MRWSIEELFKAWKYQYSFHFRWWQKMFFGWGSLWRSLKATIHWIFRGYTHEMLWHMDYYLMDVIIMKLKHFRDIDKLGHPANLESDEAWAAILNEMIDKFEKMRDTYYENMVLHTEMYTEPSKTEGYTAIKFRRQNDADDELVRKICYKAQIQNDKEALELFTEYFRDLWD